MTSADNVSIELTFVNVIHCSLPFQMVFGALVKVWAGGITLPTVPLSGSTETVTLYAPHRLTCLDRPLLSTPAALYAHRKGILHLLFY